MEPNLAYKNKFKGDESDSEIMETLNGHYQRFLDKTVYMRRQWLLNAAFARGQQFSILHRDEDRLIFLTAPEGRRMIMDDMVSPWKVHRIANMTTAIPLFEAIPDTYDSESVAAARVGTSLLNHYWDHWSFTDLYIELCGYMVDFANAFVLLNYIEDKHNFTAVPLEDSMTGEAMLDENGNTMNVQVPYGDITARVLPPQNVIVPLDMLPLAKKDWVRVREEMPLTWFTEQYGEKGSKVMEEVSDTRNHYNLSRITDIRNWRNNRLTENSATLDIYMQKPSEYNPDGMVIVSANNVLLDRKPWPYSKLDTYPMIHFHDIKASGEFFARSSIEYMIPLQKALNLLLSSLIENAEDMAHFKWLIPIQGQIEDTPVDMTEALYYNAPYKPEISDLKPMPSYVFDMVATLKSSIRDIQSYHGASMGTSVSGVRSDAHAQSLQEQDLLPLEVVDNLMSVGFREMGEQILSIAAEKLTDERIIKYVGEDKRHSIMKFKGSMLGNTRNVNVRMGGIHLRNKAATTQTILQMFQYNMFTDRFGMPDIKKAQKLLEFAIPDSGFDDFRLHNDLAMRENDKMMEGLQPPVLPIQDHRIHLDEHERYMNGPDFMDLFEEAKQNASIIQNFFAHNQMHSMAIAETMQLLQPQGEQQGAAPQGAARQETERQ